MYLYDDRRALKLVSDNGESIVVSFAYKNIQFNSETVVSNLTHSQRITVELMQQWR